MSRIILNLNTMVETSKEESLRLQELLKLDTWESWYDDRTYTDTFGNEVRAYDDGADMPITVMEVQPDGVPDNPRCNLG